MRYEIAKTGVNEYAGLLAHLKFDKSARRKDRPALNLRKADIGRVIRHNRDCNAHISLVILFTGRNCPIGR